MQVARCCARFHLFYLALSVGVTRFELLFMPEHANHVTIRKLFFQNVLYNPVTGGLPEKLATYVAILIEEENWKMADCMTNVLIAVQNRYQWQDRSEMSQELSATALWRALREAWSDSRYWFSVAELPELECLCAYWGLRIQIYEHRRTEDEESFFMPMAMSTSLPACAQEEMVVRVVLVTDPTTGCGHFSRLFTSEEWAQLLAMEDDQAQDGNTTSSSSDESQSSRTIPGRNPVHRPCVNQLPDTVPDEECSDIDSLSDTSDGFDASDVTVDPSKTFVTREDEDLEIIDRLKLHLRSRPLMPCDPVDHTVGYSRIQSGIKLPLLHCAFSNCTWTADYKDPNMPDTLSHWALEWCLFLHLMEQHRPAFRDLLQDWFDSYPAGEQALSTLPWECSKARRSQQQKRQDDLFLTIYSFYMAAVKEKEREGMPVVGIGKDRQVLRPLNNIMPSVKALICFGCAQIHTMAPLWSRMYTQFKRK